MDGPDDTIKLYRCPRVEIGDPVVERLERIGALPGVRRVVGLPDIHLKPKLESPSSTAVATEGVLSPQLSSPSPNCGMAMLALDLEADAVASRVDEFFAVLRGAVPMKRSAFRLTPADALRAMREGAGFTRSWARDVEYPAERIDDGGCLPLPLGDELQDLVPASLVRVAVDDYGALGGGNHFLELERVVEIDDEPAARAFGLREGQAVLLFHTGSGMFGYEIGRLYSHRRKVSPRLLPGIMVRKVAFHAHRARSWDERVRRFRLFVQPTMFALVDGSSREGDEMVTALHAAMNFGYANRSAVAAIIGAVVRTLFGDVPVRLVYDSCHNSISRLDGRWIHRHNSSRAIPPAQERREAFSALGQPILLPGLDRSSSYVMRPGAGAVHSLFSVDHGAGGTVSLLGRNDGGLPATRRFRFDGRVEEVEHITDDGIDCVAGTLAGADLAHPVARVTPMAVLKE